VIAETSWLILDRLGTAAQAAFIRLITSGQLTPVNLTDADWQRCAELVEQVDLGGLSPQSVRGL